MLPCIKFLLPWEHIIGNVYSLLSDVEQIVATLNKCGTCIVRMESFEYKPEVEETLR